MVNPNNAIVNNVPNDDADSADEPYVRPISSSDKPTRDFRKVLNQSGKKENKKITDDEDDIAEKNAAKFFDDDSEQQKGVVLKGPGKDDEEDASQIAAVSLFDLSKGAQQVKEPAETREKAFQKVASVESPSDLFKRMASPAKSPRKEFKEFNVPIEQKAEVPLQKKTEEPAVDKFTVKYHQEQPDLSYVNPLGGIPQAELTLPITPSAAIVKPATLDPDFQKLIEQIVKNMYTVEKMGQTDTVMTLQYPPIFKDAKITITSYDTARGQFNVTFDNLTQPAQQLLDSESNRKTLVAALEKKGYNIHIITTTTVQIENIPLIHDPNSRDQERGGRGSGSGSGGESGSESGRQFGQREQQQ
jgi:hypothetical protein